MYTKIINRLECETEICKEWRVDMGSREMGEGWNMSVQYTLFRFMNCQKEIYLGNGCKN